MNTVRSIFAICLIAATCAASGIFFGKPAAAATRLSASPLLGGSLNRRSMLAAKPLATWSQAGAAPLNHPWGMALDSSGNLWVANQGSNQILKYDSNLVQHTAHTITANVSGPTAVAFDSKGNLYVANQGTSTITEYDPSTKAQIPARTLANGILSPKWLAIDGVDDIWVNNGFQNVNVYSADETFIKTLPLSHPGAIAVHGGFLDIGSGTAELNMVLQQELVSNNQIGTFYTGVELTGAAMTQMEIIITRTLEPTRYFSITTRSVRRAPLRLHRLHRSRPTALPPTSHAIISSSAAGTPAKSRSTPRRARC